MNAIYYYAVAAAASQGKTISNDPNIGYAMLLGIVAGLIMCGMVEWTCRKDKDEYNKYDEMIWK